MTNDKSLPDVSQVILLIPGIRDFGDWTNKAKRIFEENPQCRAFRVGIDYYDALSFLSPTDKSQQPYEKLVSQYQTAAAQYPEATVSIVAHSFGTFLVGRLLREYDCERLGRVILCGSVLPKDYDWDNVRHQFRGPDCLLNECGYSDSWPVIAGLLRGRYGPGGVYGFDQIYPQNRWYNGGHNLFFRNPHMKAWPAFTVAGTFPKSNAEMPQPGIFVRFCKTIPGSQFLLGCLLTLLWFCLLRIYWLIAIAIIILVLWIFFAAPKIVDAQTFIDEWRVNTTQQMQLDYVRTHSNMTGVCEIDSKAPVGTEFQLLWPSGAKLDSRFGNLSVTPQTPNGTKAYPAGSKLKFKGSIKSVTDYLGVHVAEATIEVVHDKK